MIRRFLRCFLIPGAKLHQRFHWRRLVIIGVAGPLILYVLPAFAAFLFVRYRQHIDNVGFLDLLLPSRWSHYRTARGDHHIAGAQRLAAQGKRLEALLLVRTGITKSPSNRDGRLLLAQLMVEAHRPDTALQVLAEGFQFHRDDPVYLRPLLGCLLQQQQDYRVVALAREAIHASSKPTESARLLALAAATASYFRGNYDQANDFLQIMPQLDRSRDGRLLTAKMDWDRGYRDLALLQFRTLAVDWPHDPEIHADLAAHLLKHGLHDEARRVSLAFQITHPTLPGPRIELLNAYHRAGERDRIAHEAEALIRDFATDSAALLSLADFAANVGNVALARRLDDHARTNRLPREAHAILVIEALIVARDYQAALDAVRNLQRENPGWDARYVSLLGSLQAIAHCGLGDSKAGRLFLSSYLNRSDLRAENLLAIAKRLSDVDASEEARQTVLRAVATDPLNQAALTRLVELDLNLNRIDELPAHLRRLLTMRKPSPDLLLVARHKLGSDLFLFSADRPATLEAIRLALEKVPPAARSL